MRRDDMSLDSLLADPLIRLVMKSDGVVEGDILALASRHKARRRETLGGFPPPFAHDRGAPCRLVA